MLALRWLAFFVLADLITAIAVAGLIFLLMHIRSFLGAVWEALSNPIYEPYGLAIVWAIYSVKVEDTLGFVWLLFGAAVLPGLGIAFWMARGSLNHTTWRFWTWRDERTSPGSAQDAREGA